MYKIIRFYKDGDKRRVIKQGLTLEEAQKHCRDPRTKKENKKGELLWFDGYESE